MNEFDKDPTDENIDAAISEDRVGNLQWINDFIDVLITHGSKSVFSIDAKWGNGKTFAVKEAARIINASSGVSPKNDDQPLMTMATDLDCKEKLKDEEMKAIYFNAWEYDNDDEPMLSLTYALINGLGYGNSEKEISNNLKANLESIISSFANSQTDTSGSQIENWDERIKRIKAYEEKRRCVTEAFAEILDKNCKKLVIFIDELDRCRPTYTIKMIENIKHYLEIDNVSIVLSVDLKQLSHSIKKEYGDTFDADDYLDKIIDFRLKLPEPNMKAYVKYIQSFPVTHAWNDQNNVYSKVIIGLSDRFSLSYRNLNHFLAYMEQELEKDSKENNGLSMYREIVFANIMVLPYLVCTALFSKEKFSSFMKGDFSDYDGFLLSNEHFKTMVDFYLVSKERGEPVEEGREIDLANKLCSAIVKSYHGKTETDITTGNFRPYDFDNLSSKLDLLFFLKDQSK